MSQVASVQTEIESNIARLLGAALTLMAQTPFFVAQPLPDVSADEFTDALVSIDRRNCSLVLDGSLTEEGLVTMRQNSARIVQLGVLWRVVCHLERSAGILLEEDKAFIVRCLGPAADSVFLLGTRLLSFLMEEAPSKTEQPLHERFTWELLMVQGTIQSARENLRTSPLLRPELRRYMRATLWAFQVACDALLVIGSR